MDTWVKKAYDNWSQVVEYDGKSLLNLSQMKKSSTSTDPPLSPINFPNTLDNQIPPQRFPASVPPEPLVDQTVLAGGQHRLTESKYFHCSRYLVTIDDGTIC